MRNTSKLVAIFVIICGVQYANAGVSVEEMKKAGMLVRSICQPKFNIPDDQADGYAKGIFPDDKNSKCYVNCVFENMQSMKRGKFQFEATKKQVELLLEGELRDANIKAFEACKSCTDGIKDHCEAGFSLLLCLHKNTKLFVFP
ncbi:general odorant-binding protein 72-like [Lutzomyia longipalpis]|nr:general odorant-binding protein 72-like [Lutzomyia longipalpis]